MSKLSQQDVNKLKTLAKKLAITNPVEQALVKDAYSGIALSGATGEFQHQLYRQAKALSSLEEALLLLTGDEDCLPAKHCSVILEEVPRDKKIAILKVVRTITGHGLKEAKEMVESTPCNLFDRLSSREANHIERLLQAAGAKVRVLA